MSCSGVFIGLARWNHYESPEHGPFTLFTWRLCRAPSVCCVLTILMILMIHKETQERNLLSLWPDGLKGGLFHFYLFFLFPVTWVSAVCHLHICYRHKLSLLFLWVQKNGNIAKSKALQDTEFSVEKARIYVIKTSILVAWAIVGGKKIQHFCVLLGTGEESLQGDLILSLINLSHFSLSFYFITRVVRVCHYIYIYIFVSVDST